MNSNTHQQFETNWTVIWILFLSGCTIALHVGKFPAALPLIEKEFGLTLSQTGTLVSIYAILIAFGGLLSGMSVARVGYVWFALAGVALCMLGSLAGAFVTSVPMLMLTRATEGLGWVLGVVSIPVLMSTLASAKDRPVVMGLWGAFMGVGGAFILFASPYLHDIGGWRLAWALSAALSAIGVAAMALTCYKQRGNLAQLTSARQSPGLQDLWQKRAVAVFVCFLCYSFQYVCATSYLPTLLIQDSSMSLASASRWTALILIPNAIGNISAGWIINRGVKRSTILAVAALLTGIFSFVLFSVTDTSIRLSAAILMAAIGGIIPGTLFSTATLVASTAAGAGVVIGFMLTGTGFGQLLGPVLLTRVVEWSSHWYSGGLLCLGVGLLGAYFAFWLRDIPAVKAK